MSGTSERDAVPAGPVDLDHLAAQTFGDDGLRREVLGLFVAQARRLIGEAAAAEGSRGVVAHKISGSARGIGAVAVAAAAERVERAAAEGRGDEAAFAALATAVDDACRFIEDDLLGGR